MNDRIKNLTSVATLFLLCLTAVPDASAAFVVPPASAAAFVAPLGLTGRIALDAVGVDARVAQSVFQVDS